MLYDALSTHAFRTSLDAYSDLIVHLYRALASAAQAEVIIDSGKSPAAAAQLLRTPLELSVIHLVRDPRATGFSWQRVRDADQRGARQQTRISYVSNAASWLAWNAAAEMIRGRVDPRDWFRMRYEDFVAAPELVLGQIVAAFGLSTAGWPIHGREARLGTHHTVEGNPSRFKTGSVLIQGDDEWMRKMSAGARVVSVALTAPLFVAYGYHKRLAPAGTPGISLQH